MSKTYLQLGAIMKSKDGNFYHKIKDDVGFKVNGSSLDKPYINMQKPGAKADKYLEKGFWTEEQAAAEKAKINPGIKYLLSVIVGGKFIEIGWIKENNEGGKYMHIKDDVVINANGQLFTNKFINLEKPVSKIERFLEKGTITEEQAEKRLSTIPSYIIYESTMVFES